MSLTNYMLCVLLLAPIQSQSASSKPPLNDSDEMCGNYALFVALNSLDANLPQLEDLDETLGQPPRGGHSLANLAEAAQKHGFQTLGVQTTLENLSVRPGRFACIVHLNYEHFALIRSVDSLGVHVIDPPDSHLVAVNLWKAVWSGDSLLISKDPLLSEAEVNVIAENQVRSIATRRAKRGWLLTLIAMGVIGTITFYVSRKYHGSQT